MCHHSSCPHVMVEEAAEAEKCLLVYCKPVAFYHILKCRGDRIPLFLPRCLSYRIELKHKSKTKSDSELENGNVIFNYRDQNNLLRETEVTRRFSCPICLLCCGSFKGLRCHLISSHDLFKFEFWVNEDYRAVNVTVRTDAFQTIADESEPRLQSFCFCKKPRKRKRPEDPQERGRHVYLHVLEPAVNIERLQNGSLETNDGQKDPSSCPSNGKLHNLTIMGEGRGYENGKGNGMDYTSDNANPGAPVARAQPLEDIECMSADKFMPPTLVPIAKSRKLSCERSEPKSSTLLVKRQFYHSHRAQPMALEQVLSDKDSEDEVDDDIADLEDRRMLDDFVDVTRDEKYLMHLWNSFVRKQRVLADGHIPWACEAFVHQHWKILSASLYSEWRLLMIKFWNHGLLDGSTMNNCNLILQKYIEEEALAVGNCSNSSKPKASCDMDSAI